jgi:hypothetical protein
MRTIWQDDTRRELQGRLATLTPDRRAQWGKMSAPEMVCYLSESMKMAIGDLSCRLQRTVGTGHLSSRRLARVDPALHREDRRDARPVPGVRRRHHGRQESARGSPRIGNDASTSLNIRHSASSRRGVGRSHRHIDHHLRAVRFE